MRRSLRIRDKKLTEDIGQNSTYICKFCDHKGSCPTKKSVGPVNMIGNGVASRPSTSNERIECNIDPREFLVNCQDENLLYEPLNLTTNISHRHLSKLQIVTILVVCASVIVLFVNREYPGFLWKNNSVEVSSNTKSNFNLAYCYNFVNHHAQQLAHVNRNIKFSSQKLEALYLVQLNMQKQTHDIQTNVGNFNKGINSKIQEALTLHDADKVGIMDYALQSAGGYIISTPETYEYSNFVSYDFMGIIKFMGKLKKDSNPNLVIQPGILPGECYAFKGQRGRIQIGLAHLIEITAITIEHTSPYLVESTNSAPKDFVFYGLNDERGGERNELGCFTYKIDKNRPLQTFTIIKKNAVVPNIYQFVEFNFLTNYGNPSYTCVYRVRVHGNRKSI